METVEQTVQRIIRHQKLVSQLAVWTSIRNLAQAECQETMAEIARLAKTPKSKKGKR